MCVYISNIIQFTFFNSKITHVLQIFYSFGSLFKIGAKISSVKRDVPYIRYVSKKKSELQLLNKQMWFSITKVHIHSYT